MKIKRMSKAERLSSLDIISTLPESILETILCLLPTREAARTSILSTEWRYTWTKISKLHFFVPMGINLAKQVSKPFYDLHQLLLLHQGLIHDFSLHISFSTYGQDSFDFDQLLLHLSNNHALKKLKLQGSSHCSLPKSVFSFHHLTDLDLAYCVLDYQPTFNGFGSLVRSLSLNDVVISTKTLLHLLSNCPSLKSLTLVSFHLKIPMIEHLGGKDCTVIELFRCFPMIEHLTFGYVFEWLVLDSVTQGLPTLLFHLKYFCFKNMWFDRGLGLAFLLVLIKCSPNLEKIKLEISLHKTWYMEYPVVWEEYSDVWLEHLNELEIICFSHLKQEIEFVKFILARSPKLSKVSLRSMECEKERLEMLQVLLRAPRASRNLCLTVPSKVARVLTFR